MYIDDNKFNEKTIAKLENIRKRYKELIVKLSDMEVINDQNLYKELSKEMSNIEDISKKYDEYDSLLKNYQGASEIIKSESDCDMIDMAKEEVADIENKFEKVKDELKFLLVPPDPLADKNIIVEIRAGTGGDEAAIFCGDLFRMYSRYAEKKNWKIEIIDYNDSGVGGYKEIIFSISGKKVYENLKFEYGGHRVQRIPVTEANGRVHTSAVTVAIMPEAEEADVEINQDDLRIDVLRSGGAGGQHVNKTESAVRITHIPSGIVVKCQDDRSQHKNKASAMKVLRSRLFEREMEKLQNERSSMRKEQVGSGDRSQKIRTYNFPQNRVTDHRINLTLYKLDFFMLGELDEMIVALKINSIEEIMRNED
ncbi:MAG TPA: peptide chain release factor 1 [Spirochaetota bacterium]|nr:peptide chain release factor 1 [Spirochaetota bacterium]